MGSWDGRLAVFDLETTGVEVDSSRIVSACVAILEADGRVHAEWNWLADPGIAIPEAASAVHGITTERVRRDGRPASVVVGEITATLRTTFALGIPLVVYNAPYDLTLLDRECHRHHVDPLGSPTGVIDPLVIDKAVDRYRKGKRTLIAAADLYEVELDDAHDAASDAIAAGRVAQAMARKYPDELDIPLADLHGRQEIWYREQSERFESYIRDVRGDTEFRAETDWPLRPLVDPMVFEDTQPMDRPELRPSRTVPMFDFDEFLAQEAQRLTGPLDVSALRLAASPIEVGPSLAQQLVALPEEDVPVVEPVEATDPDDLDPDNPESAVAVVSTSSTTESTGPIDASFELEEPVFDDDDDEVEDEDDAEGADAPGPVALPRSPKLTTLRLAAGIVVDLDGRSLLVRKRGTTAFMQPGGKIEPGESALQTLTRELREEVGLVVDPAETEYLGSFRAVAANEPDTVIRAEVFYLTTPEMPVASAEIEELVWIADEEPDVELAPLTRDELLPLWTARRSALF